MNGHGWMTHGVVSGCDCVVIVTWLISCKYSSEGVSQHNSLSILFKLGHDFKWPN